MAKLPCAFLALTFVTILSISSIAAAQDRTVSLDQENLLWTGDYDGRVTGELNSYTRASVIKFQKRVGGPATGDLTQQQRLELRQVGASLKDSVGFTLVDDAATGIRLGIPTALVSHSKRSRFGSIWKSTQHAIEIDAIRLGGVMTIGELYDKLSRIKGRRLTYSPFRGDWFVLMGQDKNGERFYVRVDQRNNDVRGFSIAYADSFHARGFPLAMAMAASYDPYPDGASPQIAAPVATSTPPPAPVPPNSIAKDHDNSQLAGICFNGLGDCPAD